MCYAIYISLENIASLFLNKIEKMLKNLKKIKCCQVLFERLK